MQSRRIDGTHPPRIFGCSWDIDIPDMKVSRQAMENNVKLTTADLIWGNTRLQVSDVRETERQTKQKVEQIV